MAEETPTQGQDSQIFGVSVRAILAMFTVGTGLGFLYLSTFFLFQDDKDLTLVVVTAVVGFINLALGYYLGQKSTNSALEAENTELKARIAELENSGD
jgi:cell division protein FtsB